jgi:hypothetical protein
MSRHYWGREEPNTGDIAARLPFSTSGISATNVALISYHKLKHAYHLIYFGHSPYLSVSLKYPVVGMAWYPEHGWGSQCQGTDSFVSTTWGIVSKTTDRCIRSIKAWPPTSDYTLSLTHGVKDEFERDGGFPMARPQKNRCFGTFSKWSTSPGWLSIIPMDRKRMEYSWAGSVIG